LLLKSNGQKTKIVKKIQTVSEKQEIAASASIRQKLKFINIIRFTEPRALHQGWSRTHLTSIPFLISPFGHDDKTQTAGKLS
jgi:hypothetical protein